MSITRLLVLVAVYALTVMAPGHAETMVEQNFFKKGEAYQTASNSSYSSQDFYNMTSERLQGIAKAMINPVINIKEFDCLARNIFFEAGSEPEEGKVAVGLVTINRTTDGRFRNTICGVVDQKLTKDIPKNQIIEKKEFFRTIKETQTVWSKISICQFSWRCMFVKNPKSNDERWVESQRVALVLLSDSEHYEDLRSKYADALYFHATGIRPAWVHSKETVNRIGGHIFYKERNTNKY
jgi:spore germination cell wall hydrolase CwlJ-like protein